MAMSSRQKILLWVGIAVLVVGAGAVAAIYLIIPDQTETSLVDIPIVSQPPAPVSSPTPTPTFTPPPESAPSPTPTPTPRPTPTPPTLTEPSQPVVNPAAPTLQPTITASNSSSSAQVGATLASGEVLPGESPETGAEALIFSGIAGIMAAGGAVSIRSLRRRRKK